MTRKLPYARIAVTLPPETLRAADALAARHDRSRSWIVAEAIRRYVLEEERGGAPGSAAGALDASRLEQLRRDLALPIETRAGEGEGIAVVGKRPGKPSEPKVFATYDDFDAWRRRRTREP